MTRRSSLAGIIVCAALACSTRLIARRRRLDVAVAMPASDMDTVALASRDARPAPFVRV